MTLDKPDNQNSVNPLESEADKDLLSQKKPILTILAEARISAKKSLSQASKALNIQIYHLKAIEEGNLNALPEDVYTLGFVRSYANYLGLDRAKCVKDYKEQILFASTHKPVLAAPSPLSESMVPKRAMLILSFILVVGGYIGWLYVSEQADHKDKIVHDMQVFENEEENDSSLSNAEPEVEDPFEYEEQAIDANPQGAHNKQNVQIESVRQEDKKAETPLASSSSTEESSVSPDIVIVASQRSWIEIKDKEKILYRGILKEGESYPVPKGEELMFATGNAGGVSFLIKGEKTAPLGQTGQVMRKVPLTKESLSAVGKPIEFRQNNSGDNEHVTTRARNEGPAAD